MRKVARLNANIFYLCYTQHVQLHNLSFNHTLENLLAMLNLEVSQLGRIGAVDVTNVPIDFTTIQTSILTGEDSESDGNYYFFFLSIVFNYIFIL